MGDGWYSRGYLPHFDEPELVQSLTFRLHDSLPQAFLTDLRDQVESGVLTDRRRLKKIETYLDAGYGECWLRQPEIGRVVEEALFHGDGTRYRLFAWCVMPNHVHVLIETAEGHPLRKVLHTWKSYTAQTANRILNRQGAFWQREFFDRRVRDKRHFNGMRAYIEHNPVAAGLVEDARDWPFGSARLASDDDLW